MQTLFKVFFWRVALPSHFFSSYEVPQHPKLMDINISLKQRPSSIFKMPAISQSSGRVPIKMRRNKRERRGKCKKKGFFNVRELEREREIKSTKYGKWLNKPWSYPYSIDS